MVLGLLLMIGLYYMAFRYTEFALLDVHHGTRASQWIVAAYAGLVWALILSAMGLADRDPSKAASGMMVATGMLVGVAIAPPWRAPDEVAIGARLRLSLEGMISGALMKKVMALGAFAIASWIGKDAWIFVAVGIGGLLLVSKAFAMAPLMTSLSNEKRLPSSTLAVAYFCILMAMGPYTLAQSLPLEPASWSGFVGLGVGVLMAQFVGHL